MGGELNLRDRTELAARLTQFVSKELEYVGNLRNQMTEDFVSFVRQVSDATDESVKHAATRTMMISVQRNDLAAQIDLHILMVLNFSSDLLMNNKMPKTSDLDKLVQELIWTFTLGEFQDRFAHAFGYELDRRTRNEQAETTTDDIELF